MNSSKSNSITTTNRSKFESDKWAGRDRFVGEEGTTACFLSNWSETARTRGKKFFFVFFFVDLDFMSGFLPRLKLDLWWGEGEVAFDVKKFQNKIKKNSDAAALWPTTAPEVLRPPPSSRRRRAHCRREKRASLSSFCFVECLERGFFLIYECLALISCLYTCFGSCICMSLVFRRTLRPRPLDRRSNGRWCSC